MSGFMVTLATRLVQWWVYLYTLGVPAAVRDERQAEIESDLWEEAVEASNHGDGLGKTAVQVLTRFLLGVPADLSWRLEQIGASKGLHQDSNRRAQMTGAVVRPLMTVVLVGLGLSFIASSILSYWIPWGIRVPFSLLGAVMVLGGFFLSRRLSPSMRWVLIGALLLPGSMAVGLPVFLVLALPMLWFGIMGVRGILKERKALP